MRNRGERRAKRNDAKFTSGSFDVANTQGKFRKKTFPGYVLVRMDLDDTTWYEIRNTPSIIGFVGSGKRPIALSRREIERILGSNEVEEVKKESPKFKPDFEVGETVRVTTGPFADFNGIIEEINLDQSKVTVLVNIFGRETPVELGFTDIVKIKE